MKRPFAHIGFSMAITLIILNLLSYTYVLPVTVGLAIIFIASLALSKYRQAITVPLCMGTALFACLLFILVYNSSVVPQLALDGKGATSTFYIIDIPEATENGYTYYIKASEILLNGAPQNVKMKLNTDFLIDAKPYQLLNARLNFYSIGDSAFSSYGYWGDNVFVTARANVVKATNQYINSPAMWLYSLRMDAVKLLSSNVLGDEGAISTALVTGYRSLLSSKLRGAFASAGASHIMAVSGFHLVVVVGAFMLLLKRLRVNNRVSSILTIIALFVFIGFTGYSKSIIRAGVMMLVMLLGDLLNRRADALNSLGLAVFVICINPFAVADIGALLSVTSTLALIIMLPIFVESNLNKYAKKVMQIFAIPLSVMMFTAPIMYLFFGYITISSLISNFFVSVAGGISLVVSFVSLLFFKIGFATPLFETLITFINRQFIKIVYLFASFNNSTISTSDLFGVTLAGIVLIFALVYLLDNLKLLKIAGISSTLIMAVVLIASVIINANSATLLVLENGAMALKYKNEYVIYCPKVDCDYNEFLSFVNTNSTSINTIIAERDSDELEQFVSDYGCDNLVLMSDFDEYTYSSSENGVQIEALKNDKMSYCLLGVNNVTIVNGKNIKSNCDIKIANTIVMDYNGKIDLENGDVIYSIGNNSYKARRVDAWRK